MQLVARVPAPLFYWPLIQLASATTDDIVLGITVGSERRGNLPGATSDIRASLLLLLIEFIKKRNFSTTSSGIGRVLLMVLFGVSFATCKVNSRSGLRNLLTFYQLFVKEFGQQDVCIISSINLLAYHPC